MNEVPLLLRDLFTFSDELTGNEDLVFKGQRVVVPRACREDILDRLHNSHLGINGTHSEST